MDNKLLEVDASLLKNSMLVALNMGRWGGSKLDRTVSDEVASSKELADARMARVWKSLLPKNEWIDAIISAQKKARVFHYKNTLEWPMPGARLLTAANYLPYVEFMEERRSDTERAVAKLGEELAKPDLMEKAKTALKSMYRETDYPSIPSMLKCFYFRYAVLPLPTAASFDANVGDEQQARVRAELETQLQEAFRNANRDLWNRMFETINKIQDRLTSPKGVRDQTLHSLREMLELLDRLNVTGDERLERLRKQALEKLGTRSASDLNKDKDQKAVIASAAATIRETMSAFLPAGVAHGS